MKHKGSAIEHTGERNRELRRLFSKYYSEGHNPGDDGFYERIVKSPASRFWVSENRATEVVSAMRRGRGIGNMYGEKQRMYREIYRRAMILHASQPALPLTRIVFEVVNSPAPEFYLSPRTAWRIIGEMRRKSISVDRP